MQCSKKCNLLRVFKQFSPPPQWLAQTENPSTSRRGFSKCFIFKLVYIGAVG